LYDAVIRPVSRIFFREGGRGKRPPGAAGTKNSSPLELLAAAVILKRVNQPSQTNG